MADYDLVLPIECQRGDVSNENFALQNFQLQLMMLEEQSKDRFLMTKKEIEDDIVDATTLLHQAFREPFVLLDYQIRLMMLEQQNQKLLLMARQESQSGLVDPTNHQPQPPSAETLKPIQEEAVTLRERTENDGVSRLSTQAIITEVLKITRSMAGGYTDWHCSHIKFTGSGGLLHIQREKR